MAAKPLGPAVCFSRSAQHRVAAAQVLQGEAGVVGPGLAALRECQAIVGWGNKRAFLAARAVAWALRRPYLRLEDGFLRSVGLGKDGVPPLSLVLDRRGIYYDARRPSDLETLLQVGGWEEPELLARGQRAIELLRRHRLTKYNVSPELPPARLGLVADGRPRVLVVDQVRGDCSIAGGLARPRSFRRMLAAAEAEHPAAEILVKLHPDVLAGKRAGHLATAGAGRPRVRVLPCDVSPWSLFPLVRQVYTVSSQLGLEALLAGRPVVCYGAPFYAGWGLTEDRVRIPRRRRRRSLAELVTASYLLYARYIDPETGQRCAFERLVERLVRGPLAPPRRAG